MILLHRLTYLKYNKLLPEYDKIKIITPGKIFNEFIKDLSRDLDISEIEQVSISNYYLSLNNDYNKRYNIIQSINEKFRDRLNNNTTVFEVDIDERNKKLKILIDSLKDIVRRKQSRYKDYFSTEKIVDEDYMEPNMIKSFK